MDTLHVATIPLFGVAFIGEQRIMLLELRHAHGLFVITVQTAQSGYDGVEVRQLVVFMHSVCTLQHLRGIKGHAHAFLFLPEDEEALAAHEECHSRMQGVAAFSGQHIEAVGALGHLLPVAQHIVGAHDTFQQLQL